MFHFYKIFIALLALKCSNVSKTGKSTVPNFISNNSLSRVIPRIRSSFNINHFYSFDLKFILHTPIESINSVVHRV